MATLLAAAMAAALAQDMPSELYVVEGSRKVDNELLVGGKYSIEAQYCNGLPIWRRLHRDNEEADPMYLYLDDEKHWAIYWKPCTTEAAFRTLVPANETAAAGVAVSSPVAGLDWTRKVRSFWILEREMKVREKGCRHPRGCMQLECQEPEEDDQVCSDCELRGAVIVCGSNSKTREIVLYVVLGVIGLGLVVFLAVLLWRNYDAIYNSLYTNKDVARASYAIGLQIGRNYKAVFIAIMAVAVLLIAAGLPQAAIKEGGSYSSDWAPRGGRLEKQLEFMDQWTTPKQNGIRMYVMLGRKDGGDVMTQKMGMTMLDVLKQVYDVKLPIDYGRHNGKAIKGDLSNNSQIHLGMQDLCMSLDLPNGSPLGPLLKPMPCLAPSVLDCFFEGGWLFDDVTNGTFPPPTEWAAQHKSFRRLLAIVGAGAPMSTYDTRPKLHTATDAEFKENMKDYSSTCKHHIHASTRSLGYMYGGLEYNENGDPISAKKMISLVQTLPAQRALDYKKTLEGISERDTEDAIYDWYDKVSDLLEEIDDNEDRYPGLEVTVFMSHSPTKMFEEITRARELQLIVGIIVVYVVAVLSQYSWSDKSKSLARAALVGTTMVIISNLSGFGFVGLLGIELNHAMLQALPFVALGLGVDDMFLLMHYYRSLDAKLPVEKAIAKLFEEGGMSVTLTSVCNAVSFFAGTVLPIPALRDFLLAAGIMVVFNYIIMVYAFPAVLAVEHSWRLEAMKDSTPDAEADADEEAKGEEADGDEAKQSGDDGEEKQEPKHCPPSHDCYIAFLQRKSTMYSHTVLAVFNIVVAVTALLTFAKLDFGLSMTDLTPRGSYLARGFSDVEEYLLSQRQEHRMIINGDVFNLEKREGQLRALQFEELIAINKWTNDTAYNENPKFFIPMMHQYLAEIAVEEKKANVSQVTDPTGNKTLPLDYKATRGQLWYINDKQFYPTYHGWRNPEYQALRSAASQLTDGFGHDWGVDSYDSENRLRMFHFPYSLNKAKIDTTEAWLDHVDDMQEICDTALGEGMAFPEPTSEYLNVMEFKSLLTNFWTAAAISLVVIFCVCLLFAISLRGALLVTGVSASGMLGVAAAAMIFGLEFSSLVAVTLLMSIGMFVEFSAHVVIAYEAHSGTRLQRQEMAVRRTFIPVLEGGVSSVLSFVLLAFSEFPYVFKYFFLIFFVVILVGMNYGLLLLPAMLGLLGAEDIEPEEDVAQHEPLCSENTPASDSCAAGEKQTELPPMVDGKPVEPVEESKKGGESAPADDAAPVNGAIPEKHLSDDSDL